MSDKLRQQQLFQVMRQKHLGLGTEATSREEWMTHVHRDTYASLASHSATLEYLTLARSHTSKKITKLELIDKMCADLSKRRFEDERQDEHISQQKTKQ